MASGVDSHWVPPTATTTHAPVNTFAERLADVLVQRYEWAIVFAIVVTLVCVGLLIAFRRAIRSRDELRVGRRRAGFMRVIDRGDAEGLGRALRLALRSRGALEDLAWCLNRELDADQIEQLHAAVDRSGAVPHLRRQTGSRWALQRGRAALLLGRLRVSGAEADLGRLLNDPDTDVQRAAAEALAHIESPEATTEFFAGLRQENMRPERIVEWLTGPWALKPLILASFDPAYRDIRPWIFEAIGLTGLRHAAPFVASALKDVDATEEERIKGARALGRLANPAFAPQLTRMLKNDASWPVRAQAARALAGIGDAASITALRAQLGDPAWWVRANSAHALRSLGAPGLEALRDALVDTDRYASDRAYEALTLHLAETAPRGRQLVAAC